MQFDGWVFGRQRVVLGFFFFFGRRLAGVRGVRLFPLSAYSRPLSVACAASCTLMSPRRHRVCRAALCFGVSFDRLGSDGQPGQAAASEGALQPVHDHVALAWPVSGWLRA